MPTQKKATTQKEAPARYHPFRRRPRGSKIKWTTSHSFRNDARGKSRNNLWFHRQGIRIGMSPINHPLWFPLRKSLGSFPHSLHIAPAPGPQLLFWLPYLGGPVLNSQCWEMCKSTPKLPAGCPKAGPRCDGSDGFGVDESHGQCRQAIQRLFQGRCKSRRSIERTATFATCLPSTNWPPLQEAQKETKPLFGCRLKGWTPKMEWRRFALDSSSKHCNGCQSA